MKRDIISIQKVVLEMNRHHLSILIDFCQIWHLLTISATHICVARVTFTSFSSLLLLVLLYILASIRCFLLLLYGCDLLLHWSIMSSINKVINIPIIISLCGLIRCKLPLPINYKLIEMYAPFQCFDQCEFIPHFLHWDSFLPFAKTTDKHHILASEIPSKNIIYQVRLLWLRRLLLLLLLL